LGDENIRLFVSQTEGKPQHEEETPSKTSDVHLTTVVLQKLVEDKNLEGIA